MPERLTDKLAKTLPPPAIGNKLYYDTDVKGFAVRVTAAGARAFVLNYRSSGRERRYTIGSFPEWTTAAARKESGELKKLIDKGHDPMGDRHEDRAAPMRAPGATRRHHEVATPPLFDGEASPMHPRRTRTGSPGRSSPPD